MKIIKPLLIGFVVAFVIGFGMQWFLSSAGVKDLDPLPIWLPAAIFGAIAAFVAGNLAGNRKVAAASGSERDAALSFTAPPGQARLYVFREGFVGMAAGLNITVDDQPVAQLKSPRVVSVPLSPGRHVLRAGFGGLAGAQNTPAEEVMDLIAGDLAFVRVTLSMGALKNTIQLNRLSPDDQLRAKLSRMTMVAAEGTGAGLRP